jgi:hypothetical protein
MSRAARIAALQLFFSAVAFAAHAEGFLDLYGGVAPARSADVTVTEFSPFLAPATAQRKVSFGASSSFGARAGRWLANVPWFGFAIDVSSVRASGSDLNIGAIPISLLLMFRWPQAASEPILKLPIQLHAAVGPSLVIVPELRIDLRPDVAKKVAESPSGGWGVDLRSGLAWNFSSRVALFAEYRYIRYHVGFKEKVCLTLRCVLINAVIPFPGASDGTRRKADATVESHQFVAGTSFRF